MSTQQFKKQGGFTLVEIAIVLVIIGLLLGGILKGQELLVGARVTNMASQNSAVQAAYYGFIDRYRSVPGDMDANDACVAIGSVLAGCSGTTGTVGGDADGRVDKGSYEEASALWAHLSAANLITGNYQGGATDAGGYTPESVAPINPFGGRTMLWRTTSYSTTNDSATERLGFIFGRLTPVKVISALDTKIDDGRPDTGVFRSTSGGESSSTPDLQDGTCVTSGSSGDDQTGNNIWNLSSESDDCNAIYLY